MRSTLKTMALASVLAIGGLAVLHVSAHAGCGGGGYPRTGGYGGGRSFNAGYNGMRGSGGCGGGCSMSGMSMPGMSHAGYAPQATSQPASTGIQYTCPMHPAVVSTNPANCPYCHMTLQRR